jgi:uncharacterized pyridoxal phosphate-containing UPF0001 family protein
MTSASVDDDRRGELDAALTAVRARIERACADAGRDQADITLVVVTKTFPASDVEHLAALGVTDVGENRDQEAAAKHASVSGAGLRWHHVGQLQTNKARSVCRYADVVHSVDRPQLVQALQRGADAAGRPLDALIQVDLDVEPPTPAAPGRDESGRGAPGRGGARPADVPALAEQVAASSGLRLRGVMAVAPQAGEPSEAFDRLREVSTTLRNDHPEAVWVSAGMSGDLEQAIAAGATHLRVGSAILGQRPRLQ